MSATAVASASVLVPKARLMAAISGAQSDVKWASILPWVWPSSRACATLLYWLAPEPI